MVSIIIPAYNEEKMLPFCLASITRLRTRETIEVIVVDNASTDKTSPTAHSFSKRLHIKVVYESRKGRGAARETGFKNAKGEILFSTDADCEVPPTWIADMMHAMQDETVVGVTGSCKITDAPFITKLAFVMGYQMATQIVYYLFHRHWCLVGFNFAVRKSAYERTKGFNILLNCREDAYFSEEIAKVGQIRLVNTTVFYSARRYKRGFLTATKEYIKNLLQTIFTEKENLILSDIRE